MTASDEDEWYPDIDPEDTLHIKKFILCLIAWALLCVFVAGVCGMCVRLFQFTAWERYGEPFQDAHHSGHRH